MKQEKSNLRLAFMGMVLALVLSPLVVILTGTPDLYALVLFPLLLMLWFVKRLSLREMGVRVGKGYGYILAVVYPAAVMAFTGFIAWVLGGIGAESIPVDRVARTIAVLFAVTFVVALLTEEGVFRGWLWGMFTRTGMRSWQTLLWTSAAFAVWHVAVPFLTPGHGMPLSGVLVYTGNIMLIGIVFGYTRIVSGSLVVPALSHALWNALTYTLYGYGTETGVMGLTSYSLYDPERGILGLALNLAVVLVLRPWRVGRNNI